MGSALHCVPLPAADLRRGARQALKPAQWREALKTAADALKSVKGNELRFIAGRLADLESMAALQVGWAPVARSRKLAVPSRRSCSSVCCWASGSSALVARECLFPGKYC